MAILTQVFKEVTTTAYLLNNVQHLQTLPGEIVLVPNVIVILKLFLINTAITAISKRSFSLVRLVKTCWRSTSNHSKLSQK